MNKCECGHLLPSIEAVATQPNPSGLDVTKFGIILQCPKCARQCMLEFDPIRAMAISMPGTHLQEYLDEHNKGKNRGQLMTCFPDNINHVLDGGPREEPTRKMILAGKEWLESNAEKQWLDNSGLSVPN